MSRFEIEETRLEELSVSQLEPILEAINLLEREANPRHADLDIEELLTLAASPGMERTKLTVRDGDGRLVALGEYRYPDDGTNGELLICDIKVLPAHRRHGIGTMMLEWIAGVAVDLGRPKLQAIVHDTVPAGAQFARRIGAEEKMVFHENVVRVGDLDRELLESWVRRGAERAPGYVVRLIEDRWPDDLLADIAHLYFVLERDMPMSDSFEPREWSADRVAELKDHHADAFDSLSAFAIHEESGTAVGMSDLIRRRTDPTRWFVTTTMVDPDHRGKSLGKWVKGAVNLAALDRWEGGVYEETGNAFTNEAMLAINHAMGFEHELTITDCYLGVDDALAYLASRS